MGDICSEPFFFLLAQVGTCQRVKELKKLCFYLLSFQRYEAKTNDDYRSANFHVFFQNLQLPIVFLWFNPVHSYF